MSKQSSGKSQAHADTQAQATAKENADAQVQEGQQDVQQEAEAPKLTPDQIRERQAGAQEVCRHLKTRNVSAEVLSSVQFVIDRYAKDLAAAKA